MPAPGTANPKFTRGGDYSEPFKFRQRPPGSAGHVILYAPTGRDGRIISGPPDNSRGNDGDFYIDPEADLYYGPKVSGVWPAGAQVPPVDYTGWTFTSQLRKTSNARDVAAYLVVDESDKANGNIVLSLAHADAEELAGVYAWDIRIEDGSSPSIVQYLLAGNATVEATVTRPN